jgi:hypothetical protein
VHIFGIMMRRLTSLFAVNAAALLSCSFAASVRAQAGPDACWTRDNPSDLAARPSPLDSTATSLGGGTIKVCYGRPSQRGRPVAGGLVPYGSPWRLGANEATSIHVPYPARIAGTNVAPGWYSLYVIAEANQWRVVVNREAQRWGVPINDEVRAKDVGSGVVPVQRVEQPVEKLTITLRPRSSSAAVMDVEWDHTRVQIPVEKR